MILIGITFKFFVVDDEKFVRCDLSDDVVFDKLIKCC